MEAATHGRGVVVGARHQMREVVPQIFHELGPAGRSGDALRETNSPIFSRDRSVLARVVCAILYRLVELLQTRELDLFP